MKQKIAIVLAAALLFFSTLAGAATLKGITYPDTVEVEGTTLDLQGLGLRSKFVFKVYVGALYLEEPTSDAELATISDTKKRISMTMMRDVDAKSITDAYREGAKANSPEGYAAVEGKFEKFLTFFTEEAKEGQVLELTYIPGNGTTAVQGGKTLGVVEGADFMKVLFAIWLGPKPPNDALKAGMLGK